MAGDNLLIVAIFARSANLASSSRILTDAICIPYMAVRIFLSRIPRQQDNQKVAMPHTFANIMFSEPAKKLQQRYGSRNQYDRIARSGTQEQSLGWNEAEFVAARDSFYLSTVTPDGWPYIQHRGGQEGFLHVLDEHTLAFADYSGNKQYISAGNLSANDRFAIFLMDYPNRTRLKIIGHAETFERGVNPELDARILSADSSLQRSSGARVEKFERIFLLHVVGFDWNCSQHITPRFTAEEWKQEKPTHDIP
jgi:uncharacterized protein